MTPDVSVVEVDGLGTVIQQRWADQALTLALEPAVGLTIEIGSEVVFLDVATARRAIVLLMMALAAHHRGEAIYQAYLDQLITSGASARHVPPIGGTS